MSNSKINILETDRVVHHKIADLHRKQSDDEYISMKQSIEENGQLIPILTYKGKLVDGRHRQRAMSELGIHEIKAIALPGNISIEDVKNRVLGTEMRRADSVAQKAIRAYLWYKETGSTQQEAGVKFGVSQTYISQAKKLEESIGSIAVGKLYNQGYLFIGNKRHTQLKTILQSISTEITDQIDDPKYSEPVRQVLDILRALDRADNMKDIVAIEAYAKKIRQEKD